RRHRRTARPHRRHPGRGARDPGAQSAVDVSGRAAGPERPRKAILPEPAGFGGDGGAALSGLSGAEDVGAPVVGELPGAASVLAVAPLGVLAHPDLLDHLVRLQLDVVAAPVAAVPLRDRAQAGEELAVHGIAVLLAIAHAAALMVAADRGHVPALIHHRVVSEGRR